MQLSLFDEAPGEPGPGARTGDAPAEVPADDRSQRELLAVYVAEIASRLGMDGPDVVDWWARERGGNGGLAAGIVVKPYEDEPVAYQVLWSDQDGWSSGPDKGGGKRMWVDYMHRGILPTPGQVAAWMRSVVVQGHNAHSTARRFRRSGAADGFAEELRRCVARVEGTAPGPG